jgi:hypothetical protein
MQIECEFGRPVGDDDDDDVADDSERREWSCPIDASMTPWVSRPSAIAARR